MNILTVNLLFSTLVFGLAAKLYLMPRLPDLEPNRMLVAGLQRGCWSRRAPLRKELRGG